MVKAEANYCPDCGSENIVKKECEQQIICQDCGLIYEPFVVIAKEKPAKEKLVSKKRRK